MSAGESTEPSVHTVRIVLPTHLRVIAGVTGEVPVTVEGAVTTKSVLDVLEAEHPRLAGTIRDRHTQRRRAFVRFFASERDLSQDEPDAELPDAVAQGTEPFLVIGAMAGG